MRSCVGLPKRCQQSADLHHPCVEQEIVALRRQAARAPLVAQVAHDLGKCHRVQDTVGGGAPLAGHLDAQCMWSSSGIECESGLMLSMQPKSSAAWYQRQSRSSRHGWALISTTTSYLAQARKRRPAVLIRTGSDWLSKAESIATYAPSPRRARSRKPFH